MEIIVWVRAVSTARCHFTVLFFLQLINYLLRYLSC